MTMTTTTKLTTVATKKRCKNMNEKLKEEIKWLTEIVDRGYAEHTSAKFRLESKYAQRILDYINKKK